MSFWKKLFSEPDWKRERWTVIFLLAGLLLSLEVHRIEVKMVHPRLLTLGAPL